MPCTPDAVDVLRKANVLVAPSMAAGVGGVWQLLIVSLTAFLHAVDIYDLTLFFGWLSMCLV